MSYRIATMVYLKLFSKWIMLNQMWHFYPGTRVFTDELFRDCCSGKNYS